MAKDNRVLRIDASRPGSSRESEGPPPILIGDVDPESQQSEEGLHLLGRVSDFHPPRTSLLPELPEGDRTNKLGLRLTSRADPVRVMNGSVHRKFHSFTHHDGIPSSPRWTIANKDKLPSLGSQQDSLESPYHLVLPKLFTNLHHPFYQNTPQRCR